MQSADKRLQANFDETTAIAYMINHSLAEAHTLDPMINELA